MHQLIYARIYKVDDFLHGEMLLLSNPRFILRMNYFSDNQGQDTTRDPRNSTRKNIISLIRQGEVKTRRKRSSDILNVCSRKMTWSINQSLVRIECRWSVCHLHRV